MPPGCPICSDTRRTKGTLIPQQIGAMHPINVACERESCILHLQQKELRKRADLHKLKAHGSGSGNAGVDRFTAVDGANAPGVPVRIRSPGASSQYFEISAMTSATDQIMSAVVPFWRFSALM